MPRRSKRVRSTIVMVVKYKLLTIKKYTNKFLEKFRHNLATRNLTLRLL